jgi:hypothetical protein
VPERAPGGAGVSGFIGIEEMLASLRQVQARAAGLGALMSRLGSDPTVGADRSRTVRVRVGADGLPDRAEVDWDWQVRVTVNGLERAVMQAARAARTAQLATLHEQWSDGGSKTRRWREGNAQLDLPGTGDLAKTVPPVPDPWPTAADAGPRRDLGDVITDALQLMRQPASAIGTPQWRGRGSAAGGHLQVEVSVDGLTSVHADRSWATGLDSSTLETELTAALQAARADLRGGGQTQTTRLLTDLIAHLASAGEVPGALAAPGPAATTAPTPTGDREA